jgi:hypothetical protein
VHRLKKRNVCYTGFSGRGLKILGAGARASGLSSQGEGTMGGLRLRDALRLGSPSLNNCDSEGSISKCIIILGLSQTARGQRYNVRGNRRWFSRGNARPAFALSNGTPAPLRETVERDFYCRQKRGNAVPKPAFRRRFLAHVSDPSIVGVAASVQ